MASPTDSCAQSPQYQSPAQPGFPTLEEVKAAIPPEGIVIVKLTALFKARLEGRNSDFIQLVKLAGMQDPATKKIIPKSEVVLFPTLEEVKAAIPSEGIVIAELTALFKPRLLERFADFAQLVKLVGMQDPASKKIIPKPQETPAFPTLEEVKAAIPLHGIPTVQLLAQFKNRLSGNTEDFFELVKCAGNMDFERKRIVPKPRDTCNGKIITMGKLSPSYKSEARKLCHFAEPERTRLWLDMFFHDEDGGRVELTSMWDVYDDCFKAPYGREEDKLDTGEWLAEIKEVLEDCSEGTYHDPDDPDNESKKVDYLEGLMPREKPKSYEDVMDTHAAVKEFQARLHKESNERKVLLHPYKREARKLGHLAEPERTRLWLDMFFVRKDGARADLFGMRECYEMMFRPFDKEVEMLDPDNWFRTLEKKWKSVSLVICELPQDSNDPTDYCEGIMFRSQLKPYDVIMKERVEKKQKAAVRRVRRREAEGGDLTTPPMNAFQRHLRAKPLLPLPRGQLGPVTLRIQARREGKPLGDAVPGFEHISMKRTQMQSKKIAKQYGLTEGIRTDWVPEREKCADSECENAAAFTNKRSDMMVEA